MAWPPRCASWALWALRSSTCRADSDDWRTVLASSSIAAAVSSRLLACASERADRFCAPAAISEEMEPNWAISLRASPTTARRLIWIWCRLSSSSPSGWRPAAWTLGVCRLQQARSRARRWASPMAVVMRRWKHQRMPPAMASSSTACTAAACMPPRPSRAGASATASSGTSRAARRRVKPARCSLPSWLRQPRGRIWPPCSTKVGRPASRSLRMRAYSASAARTSSRAGFSRTDM